MVFNMMNDMRSGINIQILSPFQGEDYGGTPTGGYAALTPGYYHITPTGSQNESLRDFVYIICFLVINILRVISCFLMVLTGDFS